MLSAYLHRLAAFLLLTVLLLLPSQVANAQTQEYGRDTYGRCTYARCAKHTVISTPTGLEVAINLTEGQKIPKSGYQVVITPLNGAGSSFQKVLIYINGELVATVEPGPNGTATWFWDASKYPGGKISFEIVDTSGQTTNQDFTIGILTDEEQPIADSPNDTTDAITQSNGGGLVSRLFSPIGAAITSFANKATEVAENIIRKLPAPVVYAFPYLLFILLLVQVLVLMLQTKRELAAIAVLDALASGQKEIMEMKQTFLSLLSHYLRTPFTILQGGIEMLQGEQIQSTQVSAIKTSVQNLKNSIETTVKAANETSHVQGATVGLSANVRRRKYMTYGLLILSVLAMGFLAFWFVYLANRVTTYDTGTIGIVIQFLLYGILAAFSFQIFRRLQLRKSERKARQLLQQEADAVQAARDNAVAGVATKFDTELRALQQHVAKLPAGTATNFVTKGVSQLVEVQKKFAAVTLLNGAHTTAQAQEVEFRALCNNTTQQLEEKLTAKNITVQVANNVVFKAQDLPLLTLVVQSLVENALAYSPEGSTIALQADEKPDGLEISVTDHGSGISEEKQRNLFQPFFKAEGAEDFTHEGMGFSLYLDKLIMAYVGGDIALTSSTNEGTQVRISLPKL